MDNRTEYRLKQIRKLDKFEIQAIAERIIDYIENNKYQLIFKTTKQICQELNISHYKFKFYLEVYRKYLNSK